MLLWNKPRATLDGGYDPKTHQLPTLTRGRTGSGSYNLGGCPPLDAITTVKSVKHEGMQVQIHTPGVNQHVGVAQVYRAITSNHV